MFGILTVPFFSINKFAPATVRLILCGLIFALFFLESFVNWKDVAKRVMYRLQKVWTDDQIGVRSIVVQACLRAFYFDLSLQHAPGVRHFGISLDKRNRTLQGPSTCS